tara:strand:+ start:155 stop:337 length:183 start_codon:yes stop_codon:yes gene_type:complete
MAIAAIDHALLRVRVACSSILASPRALLHCLAPHWYHLFIMGLFQQHFDNSPTRLLAPPL